MFRNLLLVLVSFVHAQSGRTGDPTTVPSTLGSTVVQPSNTIPVVTIIRQTIPITVATTIAPTTTTTTTTTTTITTTTATTTTTESTTLSIIVTTDSTTIPTSTVESTTTSTPTSVPVDIQTGTNPIITAGTFIFIIGLLGCMIFACLKASKMRTKTYDTEATIRFDDSPVPYVKDIKENNYYATNVDSPMSGATVAHPSFDYKKPPSIPLPQPPAPQPSENRFHQNLQMHNLQKNLISLHSADTILAPPSAPLPSPGMSEYPTLQMPKKAVESITYVPNLPIYGNQEPPELPPRSKTPTPIITNVSEGEMIEMSPLSSIPAHVHSQDSFGRHSLSSIMSPVSVNESYNDENQYSYPSQDRQSTFGLYSEYYTNPRQKTLKTSNSIHSLSDNQSDRQTLTSHSYSNLSLKSTRSSSDSRQSADRKHLSNRQSVHGSLFRQLSQQQLANKLKTQDSLDTIMEPIEE
ncbi:hypothetical protein BC833DRAFT_587297 [Globomyces pollinis-pini]|nr:hypothetical protein BC833DRAFT_587297 [Globomyces pollinis-pini]